MELAVSTMHKCSHRPQPLCNVCSIPSHWRSSCFCFIRPVCKSLGFLWTEKKECCSRTCWTDWTLKESTSNRSFWTGNASGWSIGVTAFIRDYGYAFKISEEVMVILKLGLIYKMSICLIFFNHSMTLCVDYVLNNVFKLSLLGFWWVKIILSKWKIYTQHILLLSNM